MATFADLLDRSTASLNSTQRETVRDALTTFRDTIQEEFVAYGIPLSGKNYFDEQLFAMGRELSTMLRPSPNSDGDGGPEAAILTEAAVPITDENGVLLLLED